jgi:hypothetical protein
MEKTLKAFRAELVDALIRYAEEKTAKKHHDKKYDRQDNRSPRDKMKQLRKMLPKNRSEFCRNLYNDMVDTKVHWLATKNTIEMRFKNELITGFFGRSQLRKYVREVMNSEEYSNDTLFLLEVNDLKNTNQRLGEKLKEYQSNFTTSQLYARKEKLEDTIKNLQEENEHLKATLKTLQADNNLLQEASRYEKPASPTRGFLIELIERSVPSSSETGGHEPSFFKKPKHKKDTAPLVIETLDGDDSSDELDSLCDSLNSSNSVSSERSFLR